MNKKRSRMFPYFQLYISPYNVLKTIREMMKIRKIRTTGEKQYPAGKGRVALLGDPHEVDLPLGCLRENLACVWV